MTVDSLEQLSAAFGEWRTRKRHPREKMPVELVKRARQSAKQYGVSRVVRAVKVARHHLEGPRAVRGERGRAPSRTPSYSRVDLAGMTTSARPFAELEMPSGVKVRLYSGTPEALELLSSMCGTGGGR